MDRALKNKEERQTSKNKEERQTSTPSSVTAKIQRSAKAKSKIVHIDKLKAFLGKPLKKWTLPNSEVDSDGELSQTQMDSVMFSDEESELFEYSPDSNLVEVKYLHRQMLILLWT